MQNELAIGYVKMHGFHVNPFIMILENEGRPTNLILSKNIILRFYLS